MDGAHTHGGGGGHLIPVLGALAVIGGVVWLIVTYMLLIGIAVGVTAIVSVAGLVWMAKHGGDVATVSRSALPAPEATPLPSRPSQALQGPQQIHYHLHLDGQAAEAVRRHAITDRRTTS